jgi:hypothetical protein
MGNACAVKFKRHVGKKKEFEKQAGAKKKKKNVKPIEYNRNGL